MQQILMSLPTIIIGAGVGGLTTGALLAHDGHDVIVLEKSANLGGRTASMKFKNHILDNGFHIMPFYKKSAIFTILKNLGIESRLKLMTLHFMPQQAFISILKEWLIYFAYL
jgi:all-trans-retinol 13,14-reductase